MRELLAKDQSILQKINDLQNGTSKLFQIVFERLDQLEADIPILPHNRKKIGLNIKK